jgi:2-keto-4-pentenoate hydratase
MLATVAPRTEQIAERLDMAWRSRMPIAPITETIAADDIAAAYAIQKHWTRLRLGRGEKIVGRKIGLTSKAIQQQLNVSEPDYGTLWQSSFYQAQGGRVTVPVSDFLQPRIEGEVAFLIGDRLEGPNVTQE